jgi:hypothetical protein
VLEHVDGLPLAFVQQLLDAREAVAQTDAVDTRPAHTKVAQRLAVQRVEVNTQVATQAGGFVDLEVLLRPAVGSTEPGLLVWVEVKHGADLHGHQLETYVGDIGRRAVSDTVERVVVLLAPRGWRPPEGAVPAEVVSADWHGVARTVQAADGRARSPEQRWLLSQYVHYLKEEGLSEDEPLSALSALSLMEYNNAWDAAAAVCQYADAYVQATWGARADKKTWRGSDKPPAFGPEYWATYDAHRRDENVDPNWRGAWFEWGLRNTSEMQGVEQARGAYVFVAGATLTKEDPTGADGNERWFARRVADGFEHLATGGYWRLNRLRYPDELLSQTSLEAQGQELGRWIVGSFGALADHPPPA